MQTIADIYRYLYLLRLLLPHNFVNFFYDIRRSFRKEVKIRNCHISAVTCMHMNRIHILLVYNEKRVKDLALPEFAIRRIEMLNDKEFDLWADGYDKSVGICEDADAYPFAGYRDVLNKIYEAIRSKKSASVLDIGFGTATLTKKLYDDGCEICGIDFSERMTAIAKDKMPDAVFLCHDFSKGIPDELTGMQFDFIVSTYALHHLTDTAKADFVKQLQSQLSPDGFILIGDVMFETRDQSDLCRKANADTWDSEEIYIVFDEWKTNFPEEKITFTQISHCAGIIAVKGA